MNPNDPNIQLLEIVAERLGDALRSELVFVGGAVTGLLISDPAMPAIRPTEDVDVICRWRVTDMRSVIVDVMPTLESILGFSNRWYPLALETPVRTQLPSGREISLATIWLH